MAAYYNEIDPITAAWLRELIKAGLVADGEVDTRSIEDVTPHDLRGFTQCHFFAGIGGWSYALRLAQWPDTRPVWTGSCPCQPFSLAGAGGGVFDKRHLWPAWQWLIEQCRPPSIFGEQVEAAIGHGWLDLVQADLEGLGYAVGHAALPAACVGAPHLRKRVWFVAHHDHQGLEGCEPEAGRSQQQADQRGGAAGELGNPDSRDAGWHGRNGAGAEAAGRRSGPHHGHQRDSAGVAGAVGELGNTQRHGLRSGRGPAADLTDQPGHGALRAAGRLADADQFAGRQGGEVDRGRHSGSDAGARAGSGGGVESCGTGPADSFWADADWLLCRDGKWRPVEPGTFPLAHGLPARVGRLRGYGNAIVPQVAAEFIRAAS